VYDSVRSAHLERFNRFVPAWILYHDTRYDFDSGVADEHVRLLRVSRIGVFCFLIRRRLRMVELNEPLMTGRWADVLAQIAVLRIKGLITRRRIRIAAYCIGLTDPVTKLQLRRKVPPRVGKLWSHLVLRLIVAGMDRLAIGTQGSWDLLAAYVGEGVLVRKARLFPALPNACACSQSEWRDPDAVLFLGAFAERKGVLQLMQAWERASSARALRLQLIGTGPLTNQVQSWAHDRPEVAVIVDPPRDEIHAALRRAHVVVLPSQRHGYWREQVGLPILEALGHGCEVVATDETGLASWLVDRGHEVVSLGAGRTVLADAILAACRKTRGASEILAELPAEDSRLVADRWMLGAGG
jgi:glycosyltransferase involved in cell wall biosynthesis